MVFVFSNELLTLWKKILWEKYWILTWLGLGPSQHMDAFDGEFTWLFLSPKCIGRLIAVLSATCRASTALTRNICTNLGHLLLLSADKNKWFVRKKYFKKFKNNEVTIYSFTLLCLNFHCSLWLKLANVERINESPPRHTRGALCAQVLTHINRHEIQKLMQRS